MRNRIDNDYCIVENISGMKAETFHHYFIRNVSHFENDEQSATNSTIQLGIDKFRLVSKDCDACARAVQGGYKNFIECDMIINISVSLEMDIPRYMIRCTMNGQRFMCYSRTYNL